MKIDLVGPKNRGFAMGINEAAGYIAVGMVAFLSASIANAYGVRPYPFYIGILLSILGLLSSIFLIKDTRSFVRLESQESEVPLLKNIFTETTWKHHNLGAISQGGLVNNLNDGMIWGLFPILLISKGFTAAELGQIIAIYPTVWGFSQLFTGKLADRYAKKTLLFWGMFIQGLAILGFIWAQTFNAFASLSILLGLGTAVVYPTFLAAIADNTRPSQRAQSIGVYRLWRDLGYAVGALLTGILADFWSVSTAIFAIGSITILSAIVILLRMRLVS
jgi:MFS family permease